MSHKQIFSLCYESFLNSREASTYCRGLRVDSVYYWPCSWCPEALALLKLSESLSLLHHLVTLSFLTGDIREVDQWNRAPLWDQVITESHFCVKSELRSTIERAEFSVVRWVEVTVGFTWLISTYWASGAAQSWELFLLTLFLYLLISA